MKIDQTDLVIIHALENGARPFLESIATELKIEKTEIMARLSRMEAEKLIRSYQLIIRLPVLLGGDWAYGCLLGITADPTKTLARIVEKLPYVTEVFYNLPIFYPVGPNLNILFYTQNFSATVEFCQANFNNQVGGDGSGFEYFEIYKLSDYTLPFPAPLAEAEQNLLRAIYKNPIASVEELAETVRQDEGWVEVKMNQLVANCCREKEQIVGIAQVLPELNWRVCENYCHIHFLVEDDSKLEIRSSEFEMRNLLSHPFQGRFWQLETDVWGWDDFREKVRRLLDAKAKIKGLILAEATQVINHWVAKQLFSREP
ncbi:MAG: hypothetical protein ABIK93_01175 [candidate division WOR-3 bacterium]